MMGSDHAEKNGARKIQGKTTQPDVRSDKDRRKDWGLLAYYMAGGTEKRSFTDRRVSRTRGDGSSAGSGQRNGSDRRRVVDTKYLHYGKVIDRRAGVRRGADRLDEAAAAQERYRRLGPGWLQD